MAEGVVRGRTHTPGVGNQASTLQFLAALADTQKPGHRGVNAARLHADARAAARGDRKACRRLRLARACRPVYTRPACPRARARAATPSRRREQARGRSLDPPRLAGAA